MNTINVPFESDGLLSLPSGELARKACGVSNRKTWARVKKSLGYESDVLTLHEMAIAVILQKYLKLGIRHDGISAYDTFHWLLKNQGLNQLIKGFADYGKPITYQQITQEIKENYQQCLKDSRQQLTKRQVPLSNNQQPPTMKVVKLVPKQQKQPKKEPLLVL